MLGIYASLPVGIKPAAPTVGPGRPPAHTVLFTRRPGQPRRLRPHTRHTAISGRAGRGGSGAWPSAVGADGAGAQTVLSRGRGGIGSGHSAGAFDLCPGSVDEDEVAAFMLGEKPTALYEHAKTLHGHLDRCPYGPPRIRIKEAARPGARRPGAA